MNKDSAILIDTDVFLDYLRGIPEAVRYLEELDGDLKLSAINVAELFVGIRDHERDAVVSRQPCNVISTVGRNHRFLSREDSFEMTGYR